MCGQAQGNLPDGSDVVGHILAPGAITSGGRLHQHMLGVTQTDGQPIKFQLRDIFQWWIGLQALQLFAHPLIEQSRPLIGVVGLGLDAQHGHLVLDAGECRNRCATHTLGGRVWRAPFGMGLLQSLQLAKQAVVCGIRDARRIQHVIEMPMVHE